jgi:hypothetical protein
VANLGPGRERTGKDREGTGKADWGRFGARATVFQKSNEEGGTHDGAAAAFTGAQSSDSLRLAHTP